MLQKKKILFKLLLNVNYLFIYRMDSSGSTSDGGGNAGNLSTSPNATGIRNRTDSEGSDRLILCYY